MTRAARDAFYRMGDVAPIISILSMFLAGTFLRPCG